MALMSLTLAIAACALSWWVLGAAAALCAPRLLLYFERLGAAERSRCVLGLALLPPALAVAITALVFLAPQGVIAIDGHCHGNACGAHVPFVASSDVAIMVFSVIAGLAICGWLAVTALALWRANRLTRTFAALTRPGADASYRVLDCDGFIAVCVGIWRPSVVVSRRLAAKADADQLAIVLLHEYAHACRGDNLRKLLAGIATLPWPRGRRKLVMEALHDAADQCCDDFVAREIGDPRRVANTIRLVSAWHGGSDPAFEQAVNGRIDSLLRAHGSGGNGAWIYAAALPLMIIATVAAAPALHYCSEAILRLL